MEPAHIKLPTLKNPSGVSLIFEPRHYLFPLPQTEIDANPELEQNENYL